MPTPNISAQFTDPDLADAKTALGAIAPLFPALVTLTDAERTSLARVGAGRHAFCETAYNGCESFPSVLPGFISEEEWAKDEVYYSQLWELEILIEALLGTVQDTRQAVGAERYRQARKFYDAVKNSKEDVPGLQSLYETLSAQFEGQGGDGSGSAPPAATAASDTPAA